MRRVITVALAAAALASAAGVALAEGGSTSRYGMTLSVSKAVELRVEGEKVRVRGSGYDRSRGIYVAFCVDNGPGRVPTPCGGGADTEGSSGNSVWISDLPPAYGTGLARSYGDGGSFDVEINVKAQLNDDVDCRRIRCAVVTRNDHTRSEDRSQDVLVPISFAKPEVKPAGPSAPPTKASGPTGDSGAGGDHAAAGATAASAAPAGSAAVAARPLPSASPSASAAAGTTAAPSVEPAAAADDDSAAGAPSQSAAVSASDEDGVTAAVLVATVVLAAVAGAGLLWRRRASGGASHGA